MKKNILILTAGLCALLASCEDHRLDGMEPDKVFLAKRGFVEVNSYAIGKSFREAVWTNKSGIGKTGAEVTYTVDPSLLTAYNEANGTAYRPLPEDCYTIPQTRFQMGAEDRDAKFYVDYEPDKILAYDNGEYEARNYVLPLRIEAGEGGAPLTDEIAEPNTVLLNFNVMKPDVRLYPNVKEYNYTVGETDLIEVPVQISVPFVNPWDITLAYRTDEAGLQQIVEAYNASNSTEFQLLPAEAYTLSTAQPVIEKGSMKLALTCTIDKSKVPFGKNLLPLTLQEPEAPLVLNATEGVTYICVTSVAPQLDRSGWKIRVSSEDTTENGVKENLLDGTTDTFWHVAFKGIDKDRRIYIDLGEEKLVYQVELQARSGGNSHTAFHLFTSQTGTTIINAPGAAGEKDDDAWTECGYMLIKGGSVNLRNDRIWMMDCSPAPQRTRYLKIRFDFDGNQTCLGELYVRGIDIEE